LAAAQFQAIRLATTSRQRGASRTERGVRVIADGCDCTNADHDDQGKHDGIFNRRGPIFRNQEPLYFLNKTFHHILPYWASVPDRTKGNQKKGRSKSKKETLLELAGQWRLHKSAAAKPIRNLPPVTTAATISQRNALKLSTLCSP
jgi:hypothetical protein